MTHTQRERETERISDRGKGGANEARPNLSAAPVEGGPLRLICHKQGRRL